MRQILSVLAGLALLVGSAGCTGKVDLPLADGGVDAGTPDAGTPDAGSADAGDGGASDAGASDAGDAGTSDAGTLVFDDGGVALNCAAQPSACGYPDETNTGIPAGTTLTRVPADATSGTGWSWNSTYEMVEVEGEGATLENLDIQGGVDVKASHVTLRHCRITLSGESWGVGLIHANDVTVDGCEISSPVAEGPDRLLVGIKDVYGDTTGSHIVRNDIWHASTAIQIANGLFEDNYIHDYGFNEGDHLNGVTVGGGDATALMVKHNTIFNSYGQTDAISLFQDFGGESNKTIDDNLVAGGGYCIYGGAGATQTSNIRITHNRISPLYFEAGGSYGWLAAWDDTGPDNVISGNIWDDTGHSADGDFTTHQ